MVFDKLLRLYNIPLFRELAETTARRLTVMPRVINLEVTRLCNLKCPNCYRQSEKSLAKIPGPKHLTLDKLKDMLERMPSVRLINFLSEGEPLMNPHFDELIGYCAAHGVSSMFTTNGTLVTEERVRFWEKHKVIRVYLSLDSIDKDIYQQLRPGAEFAKVYGVTRLLGLFSSIPLSVNMLLYEDALRSLLNFVNFCSEMGVEEINPLVAVYIDRDDLEEGLLERPRLNDRNRYKIQAASRLMWMNGTKWSALPVLEPTFRRCNFPFTWPAITLEGDVYPCCYIVGKGRTELYMGSPMEVPSLNYVMGNIFEEDFKGIWHGEAYRELRAYLKGTEQPIGKVITPEKLRRDRSEHIQGRFSHCAVCLWRWHVGC